MSFNENLRFYREKAGETISSFAEKIGVSYNTYAGYEIRGREPKYQTLCKIADLLKVSTDELLGRQNNILGMNEDERLKQVIDNMLDEYKSNMIHFELKQIEKDTILFMLYPSKISMSISKKALVKHLNNENKKIIQVKNKSFNNFLFDLINKYNLADSLPNDPMLLDEQGEMISNILKLYQVELKKIKTK